MTLQDYEIRCQLHTGRVDVTAGILRQAVVAQANVQATGKYALVDAGGKITSDPTGARRVPMWTDSKTLDTLLSAAAVGGGRFKVRSDHDDSLSARAGYADNLRRDGDRVTCDLHLNESYTDRAIVLEVAQDTPQLLGLSIDFTPEFEIKDGRAMMRVSELNAIDIVDSGAITPTGIFLSRSRNDNVSTSRVGSFTLSSGARAAGLSVSSFQFKLSSGAIRPVRDYGNGVFRFRIDDISALAAAQAERLSAGLDRLPPEQRSMAIARIEQAGKKTYLELVAEKKALKMSAVNAHKAVQAEKPEAYKLHLAVSGVVRSDKL